MGLLQDQLAKAGLVSEQEAKLTESCTRMDEQLAQWRLRQKVMTKHFNDMEDLKDTPTVHEFRTKARKLLVEQPDMIKEVIRLAENFKELPGGKDLAQQVSQALRKG